MAKKKTAKKRKARKPVSKPVSAATVKSAYKPLEHPFVGLKPAKSKFVVWGMWALILSVLASIMLALIETPYLAIILVAVGFLVGFLNFEHEEPVKFLVATMGLLVVAAAILLTGFSRIELTAPIIALYLKRSAYNVIAVVAPAAFVISLKALKELAE